MVSWPVMRDREIRGRIELPQGYTLRYEVAYRGHKLTYEGHGEVEITRGHQKVAWVHYELIEQLATTFAHHNLAGLRVRLDRIVNTTIGVQDTVKKELKIIRDEIVDDAIARAAQAREHRKRLRHERAKEE